MLTQPLGEDGPWSYTKSRSNEKNFTEAKYKKPKTQEA